MWDEVGLVQGAPEAPEAAEGVQACRRDEDIHEGNQDHELDHIRVDHAYHAGGGGVHQENHRGNQGSSLIRDTGLSPEQLDDRGGGCDLRGHGAHHGEGDHSRQEALGGVAKAPAKQLWDGPYAVPLAYLLYASGVG